MKSRAFTSFVAMILFASLALPVQLTAQHTQYKLIDLGTFGGPASNLAPTSNGGPENPGRALTGNGVIVGQAATATPDPTCGEQPGPREHQPGGGDHGKLLYPR